VPWGPRVRLFDLPAYGHSLKEFTVTLWLHRKLTIMLAKREISEKYIGQALGGLWAVLHPMLLLSVYYFLFSVVFQIRMPDQEGMPADYFLYILSGMAPWLSFQEAINKGSMAIRGQAPLVKQVVFPIEILPVKGVLSSFLPLCIMGTLLLVYKLAKGLPLFPGLLLLPAALFMQIVVCVGINLMTSAAGTYLRDLKDVIQAFMLIVVYLLPVFYLPDMVPQDLRPLLFWNPLSHFAWCWQDVLYFNGMHHPESWMIFFCGSFIMLALGARVFRFLKTYFGNVL
jgi:lipopolysaccharide transport system permease protein